MYFINTQVNDYDSKLINGALNGDIKAVKELLATEECTSNGINEALQAAACSGYTSIINILLTTGKCTQEAIRTSIHCAAIGDTRFDDEYAHGGHLKTMRALINRDESTTDLMDKVLYSVASYILAEGYRDINDLDIHRRIKALKLLLETGKCSEEGINRALKGAGSKKALKLLLETRKCTEKGINEALSYAASREIVELLLDTGECTEKGINEALRYAAKNVGIVKLLLKTGKCNEEGINAALGSVTIRESIKLLLETKQYKEEGINKALKNAAFYNDEEMVEMLLETKQYTEEGINEALRYAVKNECEKIVKLLLGTKQYTEEGINKALEGAVYWSHKKIVELLLKTGKCSKEAIKKMLFNENGELKDKFNTEEIREAIIKNSYLDKEIFEKLYSIEEGAKEISEKYQDKLGLREYQKDYVLLHNMETYFLNKNLLISTNVMKFLTKVTQYHFGENNKIITHNILRYVDGNEGDTIKKIYKAIMGEPKNKRKE